MGQQRCDPPNWGLVMVPSATSPSNVVITGAVPHAKSNKALVGTGTVRLQQRNGTYGPPILLQQLYYIAGAPNILCENQIIRQIIPDATQRNARALHTHIDMGAWDIELDRDSKPDQTIVSTNVKNE
ncbi:hypothetical protein RI054_06g35140 [Pseudoscourfieldia marina]